MFIEYNTLVKPLKIIRYRTGFFIVGVRKILLTILYPNRARDLILTKVIYIPRIGVSLLLVSNLNRNGIRYSLITSYYKFTDLTNNKVIYIRS